jgi:membrane-associated phospholipid phosphatase
VRAHRIYTRRTEARELREEAAERAFLRPHRDHISNAEEAEYRRPNGELSYIANYSKGLRHNNLGEVIARSYRSLLRPLHSGNPDHFEQIRLGRPDDGLDLTNPQSGLAFDLEGPDAQAVTMPPAPRIDSPENSAEMGELYWMALLRDVPFTNPPAGGTDYSNNPTVGTAAASLSGGDFSDFRGPRDAAGNVTRDTLFRGFTRGDLVGPYISQFLLIGNADPALVLTPASGLITYGTLKIDQRQRTVLSPGPPGSDFLTTFPAWLDVQNGADLTNLALGLNPFDGTRRFVRNLRDLANYVHFDALYEAYLNACLILLSLLPPPSAPPFDPGNPYRDSRTQEGFGTFGPPHILSLLTEVATRALKAVWFQKWFVHRRLRPEEFGGRIDVHLRGRPPAALPGTRYPMIDDEILDALQPGGGLDPYFPNNGTFLLPQAFPEGSPTHPSYGAGHATVAGACVTILKAWFDDSFVLPGPVLVPNADGTALVNAAQQVDLTVGGELNKLAANIAIGRNAAGVHWRSDYTDSVRLGEEIAIRLLQEQRPTYNEDHHFTLTRFADRTRITI